MSSESYFLAEESPELPRYRPSASFMARLLRFSECSETQVGASNGLSGDDPGGFNGLGAAHLPHSGYRKAAISEDWRAASGPNVSLSIIWRGAWAC